MKAAIRHIEEKYGQRVYGYFLLCGTTTEWFSHFDKEAPHPIKNAGYQAWLGDKNAELPAVERLEREGDIFLGQDEQDVYLARKFHNELIADLALYFVKEAQSVINHQKLMGLYYGYLFELGGQRLYNDGALGYEKVFLSPDVDMISSPSAYGYRGIADPSAFMLTQKTLDVHNKLYFLEFDHITHVAPERITDRLDPNSPNGNLVVIPGAKNKCKSEAESLNLMYRDFVLCKANGAAMWWFDMFDGWFRSEGMMNAVANMIGISQTLSQKPNPSAAQIAVFAEGDAMYRARKSAGLATVCLSDIRRTLAQCGAPYDLYSICDVGQDLSQYKLVLFVNQYDIPDTTRAQIETACKDKTALWLYAPNYAKGGHCAAENITAITGMKVTESRVSHGGLVYGGDTANYGLAAPYFAVCEKDAAPLARFEDGAVAVAQKGSSIYAATCNLPAALLRQIAESAGIFLYSRDSRVYTYPRKESIGIYNASGGDATVYLPEDGTYRDLITGEIFCCLQGQLNIKARELNAFLLAKE